MKPYFKLRDYKDKNDLQQVQLYYFQKGNILRLDVGIKTKAIYWNTETEKITSRAKEIDQDSDKLNKILREKMQKLEGIVLDYSRTNHTEPDIATVKAEFYKEAIKIQQDKDVIQDFEDWIKQLTVSYTSVYTTIKRDIEAVIDNNKLYYRNLDQEFFNKLIEFWKNKPSLQEKGEKTLQNSTINKRLKYFKKFLKDKAKNNGPNKWNYYEKINTELSIVKEAPIIIPTPEEFKLICNKIVPIENLDDARDLYVIGCTTGLRYSDVIRLTTDNIKTIRKQKYVKTFTQKTNQELLIPLNPIADKFITKQFNNGGIKKISNQKLNDHLHLLFGFLELKRNVTILEKRPDSNQPEYITVPLSQALAFHSARRFFISTLVNSKKVNLGNIMAWSGHTEIKTVNKYIIKGFNEEVEMREVFTE